MTVSRIKIAPVVRGQAERIHLTGSPLFDVRAVVAETESVAGGEFDVAAVGCGYVRLIVEAMASVDPTVGTASQAVDHAVSVARRIEWTEQFDALVSFVVAVVIAQKNNVGNVEADHAAVGR